MTLGTAPPPLGTAQFGDGGRALNGDAGRHAVPVVLETALAVPVVLETALVTAGVR
jgi:hypothetical protein